MKNSDYINKERKDYSIYILQNRALPFIGDGLKSVQRRILWTAKDGSKYKTSSLAGATMPLHPHGDPSTSINTLAAPYNNNIPLLDGIGAFGTLTNPTSYGASRYTSVKISEFSKDVLFKDLEIIPMIKNYDETLDEPLYFLPLIPITLLNPVDGIAIGFATSILPRSLKDIINEQINFLTIKNYKIKDKKIYFKPTNSNSIDKINDYWIFKGECEKIDNNYVLITKLPFGITHENYISYLISLIESEKEDRIIDYIDDTSNKFNIKIKFKKGVLKDIPDDELYKLLKLNNKITENINVLNFDGNSVLTTNFEEIIEKFTTWRLDWYSRRYERLIKITQEEIQKYLDIILAIDLNVGGLAKEVSSKKQLIEFLKEIGIVNIEYISTLPIYRFIEEEKIKITNKYEIENNNLINYKNILKNKEKIKEIYIEELKAILKKYE